MAKGKVAYFSMEVGLKREIPTYSGGLGILAGDSLKAAADLGLPMAGITLLYRKGNWRQRLELDGWQNEEDIEWHPARHMRQLEKQVEMEIEGKPVRLGAWQYNVRGVRGIVPVYFLDAGDDENNREVKGATDRVYDGEKSDRIRQEAILGVGGVRLLDKLGINCLKYHINEGHSAFLTFELIRQGKSLDEIIGKCVFTTHTPVEAGLERHDYDNVCNVLRGYTPQNVRELAGSDKLNMTSLAMSCSRYMDAVSKKHAETASKMFNRGIEHITNGVHSATWASASFQKLYDKYCCGWRRNAELLARAKIIPLEEIWNAHMTEKRRMIKLVNSAEKTDMSPDVLTIGFARRVAKYKRANLIFYDINELSRIGEGKLQIILAGKAHQCDEPAKHLLKELFFHIGNAGNKIKCAYLEDYNMDLGKLLTSGCDVWLNTPLAPLEASGTSGMKAAHNGVPHFSTLDGWWQEGWKEDITGWHIGKEHNNSHDIGTDSEEAQKIRGMDAKCLYEKLENVIMPAYYSNGKKFREIMRNTISINASYFNTHRMMKEYAEKAYKIDYKR